LTFEEIEHQINETMVAYEDTSEQVDSEQREEFEEYMAKIIGDLRVVEANKIDGYGHIISKLKSEEDRLSDLIKRLQGRKTATQNKQQRIKDYLLFQMISNKLEKVAGNIYTVRVSNNSSVDVFDPEILPREYCRVIPEKLEPDKGAIKDAIKTGATIPGAKISISQSVVVK